MLKIADQQTDRSQKVLFEIIPTIVEENLVEAVKTAAITLSGKRATKFAMKDAMLFPVDTAENTILSKVYFDYQKDKLPEKVAADVESRLGIYLDLHDIPESIFEYKVEKVADTGIEPTYLLPDLKLCKVACEEDMTAAAELFEREYKKLTLPERVEFAQNYVKVAKELKVKEFTSSIAKYAAQVDTDLNNTRRILELRAAAAQRKGNSGAAYMKLAEQLDEVEGEPGRDELTKLADTIYELYRAHDFSLHEYDRKMPCAYSAVFNKEAAEDESSMAKDEAGMMTKSQIIARFGEGALEEVEDEDGTVNKERLSKLIQMFPGRTNAS